MGSKEDRKMKTTLSMTVIILLAVITYNGIKTQNPRGVSKKGEMRDSEFEFIYDLTYERDGSAIHEKNIFPKIVSMVEEAEDFILIDMFLFNDDYDRKNNFEDISNRLTEAILEKKRANPKMEITFITDEINTFYGSYTSEYLERMRDEDIQIVITDLEKIRDPNPAYSGIWRTFFRRIETSGKGWLPNPFSPDSPKVTLASYLKILNMKANHRKVVITEKEALVTSFNLHDASSNHSNIALSVKGEVINDLLESENAVIRFSGGEELALESKSKVENKVKVGIITEGEIKDSLIKEIQNTGEGHKINMAMFYLADFDIVKELISASHRGVEIKIILDANKDAFGIEKNGIPNRPVGYKLINDSDGMIQIRWYNTQGEQFHTKMSLFIREDETILIGGSANLTRRNVQDYNLETNLRVVLSEDDLQSVALEKYFNRIWNNQDGEYTLDFQAYEDGSLFKKIMYYIQEKTGLSSF